MLTDEQVNAFQKNGYLNGGMVLDDAQVEVLRLELARVIAEKDREDVIQPVSLKNLRGDDSAPVWQIVNIWEASDPFRELHCHPTILEEMAQLTQSDELRIWHDQIQYKPAEIGGTTGWHQDAPLWPIIRPMTEVSAWVALDDVDMENGCMSMVPGSHEWGNQMDFIRTLESYDAMPSKFAEHPIEVVPRLVKKGEVHYHHALTWHGSHDNTSNRPRRAIAIHYMTHETRYEASGKHIMQPLVDVADGEILRGEHFPTVWQKGN
ncbi:MAG: phytanoyl-CoA dioxygenase family protein [Candidatus Latescibacteria bacterium]|nr:phytanoyl-CoA dioxygenase family protein [Candidatus Latescibacterota bacterium]